jgi:hypothetical protein
MTERTFTLDEARKILEDVRALADAMAEAHKVMDEHHDDVMDSIPTNGGGAVHRAFVDASRAAADALDALTSMGVIVRDPANGLLDFPTERDGARAFLCWKLGEDDIGFWHTTETGFAGRQPLNE